MKAKTCTHHCATCDRHFHGLEAFDLHRGFVNPKVEDWATRVCLDPERVRRDGNPELAPWTTDGVCRITPREDWDEPARGVTIWQRWRPDRHDLSDPARARDERLDPDNPEGGTIHPEVVR